MISTVFFIISAVMIVAGIIGLKMKEIWKKLLFAGITSAGMLILTLSQVTGYGLRGAAYQMIFRVIGFIFLCAILLTLAKKNSISKVEELAGIGKKMPYVFAMIVLFSAFVIGLPATGTFNGMFYSTVGLLGSSLGLWAYAAAAVNIIGMVVLAVLLFPILRQAYFPGEEAENMENVVRLNKGFVIGSALVLVLLLAVSVYPGPVINPVVEALVKLYS